MRKFAFALFLLMMGTAPAAMASGALECRMSFTMSGWSAFYKTSSGDGTVSCNNGERLNVRISAKGGGISFGKTQIDDGQGVFSDVYNIRDVIGGYATAEAHAGAGRSVKAQVVTKGPISLALTGKGRGWDIGVAFGSFVISER